MCPDFAPLKGKTNEYADCSTDPEVSTPLQRESKPSIVNSELVNYTTAEKRQREILSKCNYSLDAEFTPEELDKLVHAEILNHLSFFKTLAVVLVVLSVVMGFIIGCALFV